MSPARLSSSSSARIDGRSPAPLRPLRQWVLTVPFAWRKRVACDGPLLGEVTRIFVSTELGLYTERLSKEGVPHGQSGAVVVAQRARCDLELNPHLHVLLLDGLARTASPCTPPPAPGRWTPPAASPSASTSFGP